MAERCWTETEGTASAKIAEEARMLEDGASTARRSTGSAFVLESSCFPLLEKPPSEAASCVGVSSSQVDFLRSSQLLQGSQLPGIGPQARGASLTAAELQKLHALHWACFLGSLDIVHSLVINLGCSPLQEGLSEWGALQEESTLETPLYFAVKAGNFQVVRLLLHLNGRQLLQHRNRYHFTPLLAAAAEFLEERVGDTLRILELFYLEGVSLEEQDASGQTALMWAARRGTLPIVQWLLSKGANLNHRDAEGNSVLHAAVAGEGDLELVLFLCQKGAVKLVDSRALGPPLSAAASHAERAAGSVATDTGGFCVARRLRHRQSVLTRCLVHRQFLLWGALLFWKFQHAFTGGVGGALKSVYTLYYCILSLAPLLVFLHMERFLVASHGTYVFHGLVWAALWGVTQFLWLKTCRSDPGIVRGSLNRVREQFDTIQTHLDFRSAEFLRLPLAPSYGPHHTELQQIEREQLVLNLELCSLRGRGAETGAAATSPELAERTAQIEAALSSLGSQMFALQTGLAVERRGRLDKKYLDALLRGDALAVQSVCVTCTIVKPLRVHHCADCGGCLLRQDHHCVWVDNCVAAGNMRVFALFLFSLCLCILFHYVVTFAFVRNALTSPSEWLWMGTAIGVAALNSAWLCFAGFLLVRTARVMLTNVTFFESRKTPPHVVRRFGSDTSSWGWEFRGLTPNKAAKNCVLFWLNSKKLEEEYAREEQDPYSIELGGLNSSRSYLVANGASSSAQRLLAYSAHAVGAPPVGLTQTPHGNCEFTPGSYAVSFVPS